jgi:hypothetical protein
MRASVRLDDSARDGLYAVHVWEGDAERPSALGKAWFLLGKLILDYPILSAVEAEDPNRDIQEYLADFQSLGGNALVVHVLINPKKAFYPSRIARTDVAPDSPQDLVETFLRHADRLGFACLLSVSWDMTREADYAEFPAQIRSITTELYELYGHHPSLMGFYSYQERRTYLVPFLREFCSHVKSLHPSLLTACAPYLDDPLLAGYLSVLRDLDIIIYQGMTMASYRPDNVKRYPLRRVRDFCAVGIGGKWLQDKIALTHMELFGYLENRLSAEHNTTSYENIAYRRVPPPTRWPLTYRTASTAAAGSGRSPPPGRPSRTLRSGLFGRGERVGIAYFYYLARIGSSSAGRRPATFTPSASSACRRISGRSLRPPASPSIRSIHITRTRRPLPNSWRAGRSSSCPTFPVSTPRTAIS